MKNYKIIGLIVFLAVIAVGASLLVKSDDKNNEDNYGLNNQDNSGFVDNQNNTKETPEVTEVMITYTDNGFSPSIVTIKTGTRVTFRNQSSKNMWPATAMHPTHKVYPGSDIVKCGTAEEANIFDACRGVEVGGNWSFTFNDVGNWKYHDHINATKFGTIIVE